MRSRTMLTAVTSLAILASFAASCGNTVDPQPTTTGIISSGTPLPSQTPTETPLPSQTPWPTRIPQSESNCPGHGWTRFTRQNGLTSQSIKTIAAAEDGVIWLGLYNGRISWIYNGAVFTLPSGMGATISEVTAFVPLENGGVWIGTQGGEVALYEDNHWAWHSRVIPLDKGGTAVYDIKISPSGELWAATWDGLYWLKGEEWIDAGKPIPDLPAYSPKSLFFEEQGGLWVGARRSLKYLQSGSFIDPPVGYPYFWDITAIEEDSSGGLWFAAMEGLFRWDGEVWMKIYPPEDRELSDGEMIDIYSLSVGPDDRVWITGSEGAAVYQEGLWYPVVPDISLPEIDLTYVELDPWGAAWFASSAGLLCYLP